MCMKGGVAMWKSSSLAIDQRKVHSAWHGIKQVDPYNAWLLHTIHAQKGRNYVRLPLSSVSFSKLGTPYIIAICFKVFKIIKIGWENLANLWSWPNSPKFPSIRY